MTEPAPQPASSPDLSGSRFLGSVGVALAVAVWGSVCGSLVESAVDSGPGARRGALLAAFVLAACTAALAFAEGARLGTKEALGRALREAMRSSWQGAWLGGLLGGALTKAGGLGLLLLVLGVAVIGGLVGLFLARLWCPEERVRRLNLALSLALVGGFVVTALWGLFTSPHSSGAAVAMATQDSPVFGPSAAWVWTVGGVVPLVFAVVVCSAWTYRAEQVRGKEQALGLGWGLAVLIFAAALAAGLGAAVGAAAQWLAGQLFLSSALTPTPGKWLGAALALILWGLGRQPQPRASLADVRQRLGALAFTLLREDAASASTPPVLTESR
jgi:hypothetical protein